MGTCFWIESTHSELPAAGYQSRSAILSDKSPSQRQHLEIAARELHDGQPASQPSRKFSQNRINITVGSAIGRNWVRQTLAVPKYAHNSAGWNDTETVRAGPAYLVVRPCDSKNLSSYHGSNTKQNQIRNFQGRRMPVLVLAGIFFKYIHLFLLS